MTALQNPRTVSAASKGAVVGGDVNKVKKRWTPADRDELGEMRPSFNPGLLVSQGGAITKNPLKLHACSLICEPFKGYVF
jgi:hypothetical protein